MLHYNYYKNKSSRNLSVELSCFLAAEWLKIGDFWFLKRKLLIFYQRLRRFAGLSSHLDLRRVDKSILFMETEVVSHFFGTDDSHLHLVLGNEFGVRLENHIVHYFFFNAIHYQLDLYFEVPNDFLCVVEQFEYNFVQNTILF